MKSKHPYSQKFLDHKLLSNVTTFAGFEQRVSKLPTEKDRGDAFEVFAEAYIAIQTTLQAVEVWPYNCIPVKILEEFSLPNNDQGIDGMFCDELERTICYQVKFRTNRSPLTWRSLSTFYGLSDSLEHRLVITNSDTLPETAENREGAIFVRGTDLDELTPEQIEIIHLWISGVPRARKHKKPYPYQEQAVEDITHGLANYDRGKVLMACGAGKTLVALWVVERMSAKRVLVLCPSLALIRQILHEWMSECKVKNPPFICVCSDKTVAEVDDIKVRHSELDFPVTLTPEDVRKFLDDGSSTRFVFTTYQSSQVVASAAEGLSPFDIAIFDEAHKTAGRIGSKHATALSDSNIRISKRLFFTATPRHFDISKKDTHGNSKEVYSMDDHEIYGPVLHRLSFSKAISMNPPVITGYKIAISVVTKKEVDREAIRRGIVLLEGDTLKAKEVANQLALKAAIEKYGVSKIFSFHASVKSAAAFTGNGSDSITTHIPDFECLHVNGNMRTAYRSRIIKDFANSRRAILSNARCLTEGVDVPAVDMVAFLSPKKSVVDIVQAAGRAMRKSEGKEFGYVLIPLLLEVSNDESIQDSVANTDFGDVWRVLNRIQEHDDLLEQRIRKLKTDEGKFGSFDSRSLDERIDILANEIDFDLLRNAITTECVKSIGESWFERYGQLIAYREEHGDCDVPARYEHPQGFATWVVSQRVNRSKGNISEEKIKLLDDLGFVLEPRKARWSGYYQYLIQYKSKYGDCRVPQSWSENSRLGTWVGDQRNKYKLGLLTQDRIDLLEQIGFEWTIPSEGWSQRFEQLLDYKKSNGHTRVPAVYKDNRALGSWVVSQRSRKRKGKLSDDKITKLEEIGFEWNIREQEFSEKKQTIIGYLREIFESNQKIEIPPSHPHRKEIRAWLNSQRRKYRNGSLDQNTREVLQGFGIDLSFHTDATVEWDERLASVVCHLENGKALSRTQTDWLRHQIARLKDDRLTEKQVEQVRNCLRLREILQKSKRTCQVTVNKFWSENYPILKEAFVDHGCYVYAIMNDPSQSFLEWVLSIRKSYSKDYLDQRQKELLQQVDFYWNHHDERWRMQFEKLIVQLGSNTEKLDPSRLEKASVVWLRSQRKLYENNELSLHRKSLIENILPFWSPHESRWKFMYDQLVDYQNLFGNCNVWENWPENEKILRWIKTQRKLYAAGSMLAHREEALSDLGFDWEKSSLKKQSNWDEMYQKLTEFYNERGHCDVSHNFDHRLSYWLKKQRELKEKGMLLRSELNALSKLDFDTKPVSPVSRRIVWNRYFSELLEWKTTHGHCRITHLKEKGKSRLARWIQYQIKCKEENKLSDDQIVLFDSLSVEIPKSFDDLWLKQYINLQNYKNQFGNCIVPKDWPENPQLSRWVRTQRQHKSSGVLKAEREELLNEIQFEWVVGYRNPEPSKDWMDRYEELKRYCEVNGIIEIKKKPKANKSLGMWLSNQRTFRNRGKLEPEKEKLLSDLGVKWDPASERWDEMFERLKLFKHKNGHTRVPQSTELGRWVHNQRQNKRKNRPIIEIHTSQLDEIGFEWEIKKMPSRSWDEMFDALVEYKGKFGDCNVPQLWKEDKQLGRWVNRRRDDYRSGKLSPDRIEKLESIGFVWNTRPAYKRNSKS